MSEREEGEEREEREGAPAPPAPERPAFAEDYPRTAELDALVDAFDRGDYAAVRAGAPALAKSDDPAVKAAADDLLRRISPDPLSTALLWIGVVLLIVLAGYYWTHKHEGA